MNFAPANGEVAPSRHKSRIMLADTHRYLSFSSVHPLNVDRFTTVSSLSASMSSGDGRGEDDSRTPKRRRIAASGYEFPPQSRPSGIPDQHGSAAVPRIQQPVSTMPPSTNTPQAMPSSINTTQGLPGFDPRTSYGYAPNHPPGYLQNQPRHAYDPQPYTRHDTPFHVGGPAPMFGSYFPDPFNPPHADDPNYQRVEMPRHRTNEFGRPRTWAPTPPTKRPRSPPPEDTVKLRLSKATASSIQEIPEHKRECPVCQLDFDPGNFVGTISCCGTVMHIICFSTFLNTSTTKDKSKPRPHNCMKCRKEIDARRRLNDVFPPTGSQQWNAHQDFGVPEPLSSRLPFDLDIHSTGSGGSYRRSGPARQSGTPISGPSLFQRNQLAQLQQRSDNTRIELDRAIAIQQAARANDEMSRFILDMKVEECRREHADAEAKLRLMQQSLRTQSGPTPVSGSEDARPPFQDAPATPSPRLLSENVTAENGGVQAETEMPSSDEQVLPDSDEERNARLARLLGAELGRQASSED